MSKKAYMLASGVIGGLATVASAVVTFCVAQPLAGIVVAAIGIGVTAVNEILNLFVKKD